MAPQLKHPASTAGEITFVYTYHNLPGISDAESVDYYFPAGRRFMCDCLSRYYRGAAAIRDKGMVCSARHPDLKATLVSGRHSRVSRV
jgi:hypothetical protein